MTKSELHKPHDVDSGPVELTDTGLQRRVAILDFAVGQMHAHHRRMRRRRRVAATSAAALVIALLSVFAISVQRPLAPTRMVQDDPHPVPVNPTPSARADLAAHIMFVRTDPSVVDRYYVRTCDRVNRLSDTELVDLLASIDRPTGLIFMDGQVRLTNHVVDVPTGSENDGDTDGSPSL